MTGLRWCLVITLGLGLSAHSRAQKQSAPQPAGRSESEAITLDQSMVALNGPWKFHIGDNPRWADPNFDDSTWETVDLTPKAGSYDPNFGVAGYVPGWGGKGHPGYWGYAWYRIRVRVAARPGQRLALAGPADVDDAYQVFANGTLLGSFGKFPGPGASPGQAPVTYTTQPEIFRLPFRSSGPGSRSDAAPATEVLAFRVWMEPLTLIANGPDVGGLHDAPLLGEAGAVEAHYQLAWLALVRAEASSPIMAALFLLLALLACSLILFDRSDRVYGWLAAVFLLTAISYVIEAVGAWTQVADDVTLRLIYFLQFPLVMGGWVMLWWVWFRLRRPAWMPTAIAALTLLDMVSRALGENLFLAVPHPVGAAFHLAVRVIDRLLLLLLALVVIGGIRKQGREGWLSLPAVVLLGIFYLPQGWLAALGVRLVWFPFGATFVLGDIVSIAFAVAMVALLLRRLFLSLRRQREMALDVKQAAEVQHVLVPVKLPQVPGLAIESEYRPAREVGGDFFQILPDASDGSALIVVGDVTGHGLQAGMLVALIVGIIRNEAVRTSDPLTMLNALNRTLADRGQAHATCLALHIAADGACALANAGHLPPYLNGKELPMEGALPLGMIPSADFSLLRFHLNEDDRLILMSDGVVEAQNEHGHLFGFERVSELLKQPITAAQLATEAQNFGQEDDILVLRVMRIAQPVEATSAKAVLAMG